MFTQKDKVLTLIGDYNRYIKQRAGIAPTLLLHYFLQEGLAGRIVIAGIINISKESDDMQYFLYF